MFGKVLAVAALVTLPLCIAYWHRSHHQPVQYRWDLTLYKSMWVNLKDGVCAIELLSMPTKTASRSEFRTPLRFDASPDRSSFYFRSRRSGLYRTTWLAFPFWLPAVLITMVGAWPVFRGPGRRVWRRWRGQCAACGYDLTGNRSGRCPECGETVDHASRRRKRGVVVPATAHRRPR